MKPRSIALIVLAAAVFPAFLGAQGLPCLVPPMDDGFEVGCCAPPTPVLPTPPPMTINVAWGVFAFCALSNQFTGTVTIGTPIWFEPDYAFIPLTIALPGAAPVSTAVLGKYARTWTETLASGAPQQVYRLLINGDIPFVSTTACPAPQCLPPCTLAAIGLPVHMVGHIDWACDSTVSSGYRVAISLSHFQGCLQHAPFSSQPQAMLAASNYQYHLVGPTPFTFTQLPEPQGPVIGDSARSSTLFVSPFFYLAHGEASIQPGGILNTVANDCLCSPQINGLWRHQNLTAMSCCNGFTAPIQSQPIPGTPLSQGGLSTCSIGQWGVTSGFPGNKALFLYVGVITHNLSCSPLLWPIDAVTGVGTRDPNFGRPFPGNPSVTPCPALAILARTFIDLQNMLPIVYWPNRQPGIGSLFAADQVISLNIF